MTRLLTDLLPARPGRNGRLVERALKQIEQSAPTGARSARRFKFSRRSSGVLMHLTSLPGRHGSGDLGPQAYAFGDFLAAAGQRWWQMLPVGPPGILGNSPYSSYSAFAGSPWLVSLELLALDSL